MLYPDYFIQSPLAAGNSFAKQPGKALRRKKVVSVGSSKSGWKLLLLSIFVPPSALCSLLNLLFGQSLIWRVCGGGKTEKQGRALALALVAPSGLLTAHLSSATLWNITMPDQFYAVLQDRVMWHGCWCLEEDLNVSFYGGLESPWALKLSSCSLCSASCWKPEVVAWTVSWCLWTLFFSTSFSLWNMKQWA